MNALHRVLSLTNGITQGDKHAEHSLQETLKQNYYLWQLYHSQMDAHEAEAELESQQGKLREAAKQLKAIESTVKEKKREIAGLAKAKTSMDQKAKKRRAEEGKNVRFSAFRRIQSLPRESLHKQTSLDSYWHSSV